jgi:hypothetical protein
MVTFHPAYILRQTGGEIEAVKRMVWADLKAIRTKLDEPSVILSPSTSLRTGSVEGLNAIEALSAVEGPQEEILQAGLFE